MAEDISSKVKKIVADHLGIDEAKVTDEASFICTPKCATAKSFRIVPNFTNTDIWRF